MVKKKNLIAASFFKRHIIYRGKKIRMTAVLLSEKNYKVDLGALKEKNCQLRFLYPAKNIFQN